MIESKNQSGSSLSASQKPSLVLIKTALVKKSGYTASIQSADPGVRSGIDTNSFLEGPFARATSCPCR
ncbi:hypothetical protein GE061_001678 [Apolygus lucorum]|uniref:Uncharacterized protein n=1 Tax=Apolygus lucorum TaxID=248454 RepID=A0A8S9Y9M4_APOLU|nr:hypothetical protein GE061_001678 [Apolygus lucorum]